MLVIHANWTAGYLHLWAESLDQFNLLPTQTDPALKTESNGTAAAVAVDQAILHPYTVSSDVLMQSMESAGVALGSSEESTLALKLPRDLLGPWPSDRFISIMGEYERVSDPLLGEFSVPSVKIEPEVAVRVLNILSNHACDELFEAGQSVKFWNSAGQMAMDLLVDQRFIPTLLQVDRKHLTARWTPWLHDEEVVTRFGLLLRAMPPVARSTTTDGRNLLESAIEDMTNDVIRTILVDDDFEDAVDGCTSFALSQKASENNHLIMGQNWDWIPDIECVMTTSTDIDGQKRMAFTEAGIFGTVKVEFRKD